MGDEVSVTGTIYKDPAMQFVDRYVKNKTGCYVNLLDFDNNGAIHITDNEDRWIGWVSETAVNKNIGYTVMNILLAVQLPNTKVFEISQVVFDISWTTTLLEQPGKLRFSVPNNID